MLLTLNELMRFFGLDSTEIAAMTGVTPCAVRHWLSGRRNMGINRGLAIAFTLAVRADFEYPRKNKKIPYKIFYKI